MTHDQGIAVFIVLGIIFFLAQLAIPRSAGTGWLEAFGWVILVDAIAGLFTWLIVLAAFAVTF